jgi:hypothetical protein
VKVVFHNDNQSALKLSCNPVFHNRTKHIDVEHHFVREAAERKLVLNYIPTEDMVAGILTNGLSSAKYYMFVEQPGLYSVK